MLAEEKLLTSAGAMAKEALTHTAAAALIAHLRRASPKSLPCRKPLFSASSRHHKARYARGPDSPQGGPRKSPISVRHSRSTWEIAKRLRNCALSLHVSESISIAQAPIASTPPRNACPLPVPELDDGRFQLTISLQQQAEHR